MSGLIVRSSFRHWIRHPWQAAFAVVGIALGVGVVMAVDLATASARAAFELSSEAVFGRATHQILGGSGGLPDSVYRRLRIDVGVVAAPVVDAWGRAIGATTRTVRLLGVDPFAEAPFRAYLDAGGEGTELPALLTRPGAVLLGAETAAALDLVPGDSFAIEVAGTARPAWLAGLLRPADELSRRALADVALADLSVAQELTGRTGRIDRIDVRIPQADAGRQSLERLRAGLPAGATLAAVSGRTDAARAMTRAFETNLSAFALITLVFGALLIYDTITFSIVQRRPLIGLLRAVGVTRREVFGFVLLEVIVIGAVGTLAGLALGTALGSGLVGLVARTINDLYFSVTVSAVSLAPSSFAKAAALGIAATVAAALPPLREATATTPRSALLRSSLEDRTRRNVRVAALAGLVLLVAGLAVAAVPTRDITVAFAAIFAVVLAAALLAPFGTAFVMGALRPLAGRTFGVVGSLAVRSVPATLSRTGPAVAALLVAVSVGAAVGVMVTSFRRSVERWLDASLQADVYVAAPSPGTRGEGTLGPDAVAGIAALPGIVGITTYREASVPFGGVQVRLVAVELDPRHLAAFTFLDGAAEQVWAGFAAGDVIVSEAFAWRNAVGVGDTIALATDRGRAGFRVAGVFRDYASEFGVLFVDRPTYEAYWRDRGISSIALFARAGIEPDSIVALVRAGVRTGQALFVRSNRGLREATLEIFDRTFVITGVLRALALAVAFAGVFSALMALQLERARELGVLRATGLTPAQLGSLVLTQTGLLGLAAGLLAVPLSLGLGWLLIHVVNRRSFGWSIDMHADWTGLAQAIGLAILAALLAGLYPALRMAGTPPAAALREE